MQCFILVSFEDGTMERHISGTVPVLREQSGRDLQGYVTTINNPHIAADGHICFLLMLHFSSTGQQGLCSPLSH